jgi:hypothetical protein
VEGGVSFPVIIWSGCNQSLYVKYIHSYTAYGRVISSSARASSGFSALSVAVSCEDSVSGALLPNPIENLRKNPIFNPRSHH